MGLVDYAWSHAVISDETHKTIKTSCDFNSSDPWKNEDCDHAVDEVLKQYNEIDIYSLYTSVCFASTARSNGQSMQTSTKRSSKMVSFILKKLPIHAKLVVMHIFIQVITY